MIDTIRLDVALDILSIAFRLKANKEITASPMAVRIFAAKNINLSIYFGVKRGRERAYYTIGGVKYKVHD